MSIEGKRLSDNFRAQQLLEEVSSDSRVTDRATAILVEHIEHLTSEMLEAARTLALHRKAKEITVEDIQIVLAKKMGVEVLGLPKIKHRLHRQLLKSSLASSSESESKRLQNLSAPVVNVEVVNVKAPPVKRKAPATQEDSERGKKK